MERGQLGPLWQSGEDQRVRGGHDSDETRADWILLMWLDLLRCIVGGLMSSFHTQPVSACVLHGPTSVSGSAPYLRSLWCVSVAAHQTSFYLVSTAQIKSKQQMFTLVPGHRFFKAMTCFLGWCVLSFCFCLLKLAIRSSVKASSVRQRDKWLPVFESLHAWADSQLPAGLSYSFSGHKPADMLREIEPERHNYAGGGQPKFAGKTDWNELSVQPGSNGQVIFEYLGVGCGGGGLSFASGFVPVVLHLQQHVELLSAWTT